VTEKVRYNLEPYSALLRQRIKSEILAGLVNGLRVAYKGSVFFPTVGARVLKRCAKLSLGGPLEYLGTCHPNYGRRTWWSQSPGDPKDRRGSIEVGSHATPRGSRGILTCAFRRDCFEGSGRAVHIWRSALAPVTEMELSGDSEPWKVRNDQRGHIIKKRAMEEPSEEKTYHRRQK